MASIHIALQDISVFEREVLTKMVPQITCIGELDRLPFGFSLLNMG